MKAFADRDPRKIGAVVLTLIAVMVAAVLLLNRGMFLSGYDVQASFANAAGITPGSEVVLAGVPVGSVKSVHLDGDRVLVGMRINHGIVLPSHTQAAVSVETVLGVLDIALHPISGWGHPLGPGATITDTSVPVEFYNLQNVSGHLLSRSDAAAFNHLLNSLATVTKGKESQVAELVNGLNRFSGAIDLRSTQVRELIDAANTLAASVAAHDSRLGGLVDNLATVVQGLAAHSGDLANLIDQTEASAQATADLVGRNQPKLQQLLDNLHSVLGVLATHQLDLAEGVSYLGSALQGFSSVGYSGPQDTPNQWANTYTNLIGSAGAYGVIGNCGAMDQALDLALGPDPLPCDARSGPVPDPSTPVLPAVFQPAAGR